MEPSVDIAGILYGLWMEGGRWCYSATVFPDLYRQGIVLKLATFDINEAYHWKLKMEEMGNGVTYEVKETFRGQQ